MYKSRIFCGDRIQSNVLPATSSTLKKGMESVPKTSENLHILIWLSAQEHFIECKCHWIFTSTIVTYVIFKTIKGEFLVTNRRDTNLSRHGLPITTTFGGLGRREGVHTVLSLAVNFLLTKLVHIPGRHVS
jgi:hypothetical protein